MYALIGEYSIRFLQLMAGMILTAVGVILILQAGIGAESWSVLHQGMADYFGFTYGTGAIITGVVVIVSAYLLGERFGFGTIANVFVAALFIDFFNALDLVPPAGNMAVSLLMLLGGLEIIALGTLTYMKSRTGTGPRDALMVAVARKSGISVGVCRIIMEVIVVGIGWLLGGPVGIGTLISAVAFGLLLNITFALFRFHAVEVHQETIKETLRRFQSAAAGNTKM